MPDLLNNFLSMSVGFALGCAVMMLLEMRPMKPRVKR